MANQFLDKTGVSTLWSKVKTLVSSKPDQNGDFQGGEIITGYSQSTVQGSGVDISNVAVKSGDNTFAGNNTFNSSVYAGNIEGIDDVITIRGNGDDMGSVFIYADEVRINDEEVVTDTIYKNRSLLNIVERHTNNFKTNSSVIDLLSYMNNYNELTLIIKLDAGSSGTGNLSIGIGNSTSTLTGALTSSNAIAYGSYTKTSTNRFKITMNKTDDGYFLWTITGNGSENNFGWTNSTNFRYLRLYIPTTFTITASSVVVTGR